MPKQTGLWQCGSDVAMNLRKLGQNVARSMH